MEEPLVIVLELVVVMVNQEDQVVELEHGVEIMPQVEQEIFLLLVHQALLFKELMGLQVIQQAHQIMDLAEVVEHELPVVQEPQQPVEMVEQEKQIQFQEAQLLMQVVVEDLVIMAELAEVRDLEVVEQEQSEPQQDQVLEVMEVQILVVVQGEVIITHLVQQEAQESLF